MRLNGRKRYRPARWCDWPGDGPTGSCPDDVRYRVVYAELYCDQRLRSYSSDMSDLLACDRHLTEALDEADRCTRRARERWPDVWDPTVFGGEVVVTGRDRAHGRGGRRVWRNVTAALQPTLAVDVPAGPAPRPARVRRPPPSVAQPAAAQQTLPITVVE